MAHWMLAAAVASGSTAAPIRPLGLSEAEIADVVAFLEALTGEVTERRVPTSLPK